MIKKILRRLMGILRIARSLPAILNIIVFSPEKYGKHTKLYLKIVLRGFLSNENRPYLAGSVLALIQAMKLGKKKLYLMEFGVYKGRGLKSLVRIGKLIESYPFGIEVQVVGFDNRTGLPEIQGYKNHPEIWSISQFGMNEDFSQIDAFVKQNKAELVIGDVSETFASWLGREGDSDEAVIGFVSVDVDLYTSTVPIMHGFQAVAPNRLLPASVFYFDDVISLWSYSSYCGEGLAIREFNEHNKKRKIELKSPNLKLYALHCFDHPVRRGEEDCEAMEIEYKTLMKLFNS